MSLVRLLSILVVALSGLLSFGGGPDGVDAQAAGCGDAVCHEVVVRTGCCGEVIEETVCPMSGGDCRCVAAPAPEGPKRTEAPLPKAEQPTWLAVPAARALIGWLGGDGADRAAPSADWFGVYAGRTHNEVRALLSSWQT